MSETGASTGQDEARRNIVQLMIHDVVWVMLFIFCTLVYRLRRYGPNVVPSRGAVLIASNHQSYLDPLAVGLVITNRRVRYLARASLFRNALFGAYLRALGSIPLRDNEGDIGAIKAILASLEGGEPVLVFPEGSRSFDGKMGEFKRGIALLLKRSKCPVVPVAVEGAFDAYPRERSVPRLWGARVAVKLGAPIPHDELLVDGPDAALARLHEEIETMRLELRSHLRSATKGRYPPPGPGDSA